MRRCVALIVFALAACGDDDGVVHIDSGLDASDDDATVVHPGVDAGLDASFEGTFQCDLDAGASVTVPEGWFAGKLTHDVWWQGHPYRDPGRGAVGIYTLSRVESTRTTIKLCGITLPPYTRDVLCEANQLRFPDAMWERSSMPRFTIPTVDGVSAATALIGIDFLNNQLDRVWPTSMMTGAIACEAGTGRPCFPDHDSDSFDGITALYRVDGATYVGPYDNGLCTTGAPYTYAGGIVQTLCSACGGGWDQEVRADKVRLGVRTRVGGVGSTAGDCTASVDLRAYDCTVDPATLEPDEPRIDSQDFRCSDVEAQRLDDEQPAYRPLARDEAPGDTMPPSGWIRANRDIDKRVSNGSQSAFVRLAELSDTEPTCAQVRAATFPTM